MRAVVGSYASSKGIMANKERTVIYESQIIR